MVTGTRVQLARRDPLAASRWLERVSPHLERRGHPGHAARARPTRAGSSGWPTARPARRAPTSPPPATRWLAAGRVWEGWWAGLDLATTALRSNQLAVGRAEAGTVRSLAAAVGGAPFVAAADEILATVAERERGARRRRREPDAVDGTTDPWAPLTAREFSVARLVADGRTNAAVAEELGISPRTASAHVEHILAKLSVERRAEIAAWVARRPVVDSSASRRGPRGVASGSAPERARDGASRVGPPA